mmetsp:Transcript_9461/g.18239  ORF Transcript_9461/g.18239 Transcript_9461/m.18239 type:complete len:124 (+) Transcript_9461:129-500(+)
MLTRTLRRLAHSASNAPANPAAFRFTTTHALHATPENAELIARRVIKCIRERLLKYDPERWQGVEISYNTHWNQADGCVDIPTCIQVHEALEREFKIEIKDNRALINDISFACAIVTGEHDAI